MAVLLLSVPSVMSWKLAVLSLGMSLPKPAGICSTARTSP